MKPLELLLFGQAIASMTMFLTWLCAKRLKNASYVDALWAYGVGLLGASYLYFSEGDSFRNQALTIVLGIWSLRLGTYLLRRCLGGKEDSRYRYYREKWGERTDALFFFFFQKQAFWVVLFASPMLVVGANPEPWGKLDLIGLCIWVFGMTGVCLADLQLSRFKARAKQGQDKVCRNGLWRYSRHPNYFFEWVLWMSYVFWGWGATGGPWLLFLPVILLAFFLKFTGIPHVEARKMETAGKEYEEYRKSTSAFIPWFPRKSNRDPS